MTDTAVAILIWSVATLVALRCIVTLGTLLHDRLYELLAASVRSQRIELQKKRRIRELRMKIREKKKLEDKANRNDQQNRAA